MEHNGMEWSGMERNKVTILLFGYFTIKQSIVSTPSFGKSTEWNRL